MGLAVEYRFALFFSFADRSQGMITNVDAFKSKEHRFWVYLNEVIEEFQPTVVHMKIHDAKNHAYLFFSPEMDEQIKDLVIKSIGPMFSDYQMDDANLRWGEHDSVDGTIALLGMTPRQNVKNDAVEIVNFLDESNGFRWTKENSIALMEAVIEKNTCDRFDYCKNCQS